MGGGRQEQDHREKAVTEEEATGPMKSERVLRPRNTHYSSDEGETELGTGQPSGNMNMGPPPGSEGLGCIGKKKR